ncbi:hypothetical protein CAEBREN_09305 [Caenorhabditis brenneri]|uniref:C-type lectin domain-containing protein n=1 Tax=Caenorhabditis brenneri TaxID=135651 RepID=G0MJ56_CAEBE|nr:hypothetical protein CAEBREN_09305 [Caenorhabditis brenneri]
MKILQLALLFCFTIYAYGSTKVCAPGYKLVNGNKCWKLMNNGKTRDDAHNDCGVNQHGGLLAMPENSGDNEALKNLVKNSGHSNLWFGLYCWSGDKSQCQWDNIDSMGYDNFNSGQPNGNTNCVNFLSATGRWGSRDCGHTLPYVCELPTTTQDCGANCDTNFHNHCYKLVHSSKNFNDAESQCKSYGMHLVSIHSTLELEFVAHMYADKGTYWLGGKMPVDNQITWLDGTPQDFSPGTRVLDGACMQINIDSSHNDINWLGKNCGYTPSKFLCKRSVQAC